MKKTSISQYLEPSVFSKEDVIKLAEFIYSFWEKELDETTQRWNKQFAPKILKDIDQHNKRLKKDGYSYAFGSTETIVDKEAVLDEERNRHIRNEGFSDWKTDFDLFFSEKTVEATTPDIIAQELENGVLQKFYFRVNLPSNNEVLLSIDIQDDKGYFTVSGVDETLVRGMKDELSELLRSRQVGNAFFHTDNFKVPIVILFFILMVYSFYSLLYKVPMLQIVPGNTLLITIYLSTTLVLAILIAKGWYGYIESCFPFFKVVTKERPESSLVNNFFKFIIFLSIGALGNAFYDFLKLFIK